MKKLICLTPLLLFCIYSYCLDLYSIANGNWNSGSVWSLTPGGPPCYCTPSSADNITINHSINLTMHLINQGSAQNGITGVLTINSGGSLTGNYDIDIRSTGQLILCGTLDVRNVIFSNGSIVNVCPTGSLIVNGSFENKNNSNTVTINGSMTVYGSFINGNGGIISGSGQLTLMTGPASNTGTTFGCTGVSPCSSYPCTVTPCSILPIQLISFNAVAKNQTIELSWSTATEKNNDYFTVEKSTDGENYIVVLTQRGAGNSEHLIKYNAIDQYPLSGTSYYRLKQTDFDGQFSYSAPIAVKIQDENNFQLIPNPSNGHQVVLIIPTLDKSDLLLTIREVTGRVILENILSPEYGKTNSTFLLDPEKSMREGIYIVSITNKGTITTRKVVITN